jgi:hypothetical protein
LPPLARLDFVVFFSSDERLLAHLVGHPEPLQMLARRVLIARRTLARGSIDRTAVRAELADFAADLFQRSTPHAITIFKSVGTAIEDLVAAELALKAN